MIDGLCVQVMSLSASPSPDNLCDEGSRCVVGSPVCVEMGGVEC